MLFVCHVQLDLYVLRVLMTPFNTAACDVLGVGGCGRKFFLCSGDIMHEMQLLTPAKNCFLNKKLKI